MRRTGRTPIDDNAAYGDLDKQYAQVIYGQFLWLRVGDHRIIYTVDNGKCIVYVIDAGNRGEIYNKY